MTAHTGRIGIIGGGLGGLAAACTLAARGYAVTLFEKSPWLGGKAAVLEAAGYRFDMGPTILTLPSVLRRIFTECGRELENHLDLVPLDPQWRCFFSDGTTLDLAANIEHMCRNLDTFAPGGVASQGYRRFLEFSKRLHGISERFFFWRAIGSLWDMMDLKTMFKPAMLADVLSMKLGRSVAQCVRGHVTEERVAQMLDHFTQYVGSAPDASPAVLCSIAHMQTQEGVWYPRGGIRAVPNALAELARSLGVELRTGVGIRRVLVDGAGAVAGVQTDCGEHVPLAAVISNCDAVRTHRELLAGTKAAGRFERRRGYEPACSGVVLYLGLDRAYEHLLHHNFVFSRDPELEFDEIYRRGIPAADPTCYVCAPARTDSGVAPPGGEALYVLVHTPYIRPGQDWNRMFPAYRDTILRKLAETANLGDVEERIRFEEHLTPLDIHNRYRVLNGAIYGLASHGRYVGAFKPSNRSKDVPGLYLAGGAAHPGPGMPMVLMSGWIAADTLDKDGVVARAQSAAGTSVPVSWGKFPTCPKQGHVGNVPHAPTPWLLRFFKRYAHGYLRRNFHAVRLARHSIPLDVTDGPLLVVLNHASWWDPLVGLVLSELFPDRVHHAPIDATALGKYRFFAKLGFFGVEQGTRQGSLSFLRTSRAVLAQPRSALWITAQGRFADPRQRPPQLRPGIGHLVRRLTGGVILPLALEYPFWDERYPEALACFGEPIAIGAGSRFGVAEWMNCIEAGLTDAQDTLACMAQARDGRAFETVIGGRAGIGGIYDVWRRLKAFLCGKRFVAEHGLPETAALGGDAVSGLVFGVAVVGLVMAGIPAVLFLWNLRVYWLLPSPLGGEGLGVRGGSPPHPQPLSPKGRGEQDAPHISVLIPARNEEHVIVAAVESALASVGVVVEVLVLDDGSQDATGELVARLAQRDPRVRLISGPPLPAGWCGKQHACQVLARQARYPVLAFIDADVRLAPDGLARLAAFQETSAADLVSGIPRQETGSWLERLVIPLIHFILLGFLPMGPMRRSRNPMYAAGCGQLFLTTRAAYEAMGTHEAVRGSLHDGITLPRAYRRAGLMTDLCDATDLAVCRMYRGATALWLGLAKNATEGLARPGLIVPATLFLLGGQVLPVLLWLAWRWFTPWTAAVNALATLLLFCPRLLGITRFRQSWLGAVLHPLGIIILVAIQWYGLLRTLTGKPAVWKGRAYSAPGLVGATGHFP